MKVLDFWSGEQEHAMENWSSWIPIVRERFARCVSEILEIHCLDSMEISEWNIVQSAWADFHFHQDFRQVPDNLDMVCALHPAPQCVLPHASYWSEEDFQHFRYPIILGHLVEKNLKLWGIVAVQFDNETAQMKHSKWSEEFLISLERELRDRFYLKRKPLEEMRIWSFLSPIYRFHSLHIFEKQNPN